MMVTTHSQLLKAMVVTLEYSNCIFIDGRAQSYYFSLMALSTTKSSKSTCTVFATSGEIARHRTFEISGKNMTTSTNLVSVHTNLLCV